ncbi:MAG: YbaB/EbfC family nucleoid-associated protein [Bacilli bacterium]
MNMQNIMMQAKKMQKDIEKIQSDLESQVYEGNSQLVTAIINGKNKLMSIKINDADLSSDDMEVLEDMVVVAVNNAIEKMEADKAQKLGKYSQFLNGMM